MERIPVHVRAWDAILEAGVATQLRSAPEVVVVGPAEAESARVTVLVADTVNDLVVQSLRKLRRANTSRGVLISGTLDETALVAAVEAGAVALLRRCEATPDKVIQAITGAAANEGTVPPDLLGRLLEQVGTMQRDVLGPKGLSFNRLGTRELEVLRLVADGCDTSEIAERLSYSERTVKNVLHDITNRLQLRNRSHAVAWALREGLI